MVNLTRVLVAFSLAPFLVSPALALEPGEVGVFFDPGASVVAMDVPPFAEATVYVVANVPPDGIDGFLVQGAEAPGVGIHIGNAMHPGGGPFTVTGFLDYCNAASHPAAGCGAPTGSLLVLSQVQVLRVTPEETVGNFELTCPTIAGTAPVTPFYESCDTGEQVEFELGNMTLNFSTTVSQPQTSFSAAKARY